MQIDNSGDIWVGTLDGLFKINPSTAQITVRIPFVSGQIVQAIAVDPSGKVWAGTPRNVIEINPKTNKAIARINPVTGRDIVALASDKNGELWIGMRDGVVLANTYNGTITASVYNLPNSAIVNLLIRDRLVWIGTEGGLAKINAKLKKSDIPNASATTVYKIKK
jgi:ligand-binding sensor domain-containing protein